MRAEHIGADEIIGTEDRAIDVRFGREVHHRIDAMLLEQRAHRSLITDVAAHEQIARIALQAGKVLEIPGVGQRIEHHHPTFAGALQPLAHEVRTDEARASGNAYVTGFEAHSTSSLSGGANARQGSRAAHASPRYRAR